MANNITSWANWGLALTFVVGGLGAITGMVPAGWEGWITLVVTALTTILHQRQVNTVGIKGV